MTNINLIICIFNDHTLNRIENSGRLQTANVQADTGLKRRIIDLAPATIENILETAVGFY